MSRPSTPSSRYTPPPSARSYRWFVILCLLAILTLSLREDVHHLPRVNNDPNFNFLLFSQQTSPGYCVAHGHCIKEHIRPFWTIHGLWPSNDSSWPENCNHSVKFDMHLLEPIKDKLNTYWPSVTANNSQFFWTHEWDKHGTCAMKLPRLSGVINYFNHTLELMSKYNVTKFLADENIIPSTTRTYQVAQILKALSDDLSSRANVVCVRADAYSSPILTEIRFCLSKDNLEPIDCKVKHENCGDEVFYLPEGHSQGDFTGWPRFFVEITIMYIKYFAFH